ncbi:MAG: hypothetical protein HOQ24_16025, partial [Mycobacteriaceae bacterium]|nr:hypothetical protein [Mycobacteriaceae bacterium]
GAARSGVLPVELASAAAEPGAATAPKAEYAKFVNGYVFSLADGDVVSVIGKLLETFLQLGQTAGKLGLPLADQYLVPGGYRQDFQFGSLVFNQGAGIVTTILKTFNNTYTKEYNAPSGN